MLPGEVNRGMEQQVFRRRDQRARKRFRSRPSLAPEHVLVECERMIRRQMGQVQLNTDTRHLGILERREMVVPTNEETAQHLVLGYGPSARFERLTGALRILVPDEDVGIPHRPPAQRRVNERTDSGSLEQHERDATLGKNGARLLETSREVLHAELDRERLTPGLLQDVRRYILGESMQHAGNMARREFPVGEEDDPSPIRHR